MVGKLVPLCQQTWAKLLKKIEADDVKFIRLQFTDVLGMAKNAAIPVVQAEKSLTEGTWFDGSSIEGFTRIEESDMLLKAESGIVHLLSRGGPRKAKSPGSCVMCTLMGTNRSKATPATF